MGASIAESERQTQSTWPTGIRDADPGGTKSSRVSKELQSGQWHLSLAGCLWLKQLSY